MSKVIYRLRTGVQEFEASPERYAEMVAKHPGSFVKLREESVKEVRTAAPIEPVEKEVAPAPQPRGSRRSSRVDNATAKGSPKQVRTPDAPPAEAAGVNTGTEEQPADPNEGAEKD